MAVQRCNHSRLSRRCMIAWSCSTSSLLQLCSLQRCRAWTPKVNNDIILTRIAVGSCFRHYGLQQTHVIAQQSLGCVISHCFDQRLRPLTCLNFCQEHVKCRQYSPENQSMAQLPEKCRSRLTVSRGWTVILYVFFTAGHNQSKPTLSQAVQPYEMLSNAVHILLAAWHSQRSNMQSSTVHNACV